MGSWRRATCAVVMAWLALDGVFSGEEPEETAADVAMKGDAAYQAGDWAACAKHYARASRLAGPGVHAGASYNAACCHALAADADRAFAELDRAIAGGFRDAAHARADGDLASLHYDSRWPTTMARIEAALEAYRATINVELLELYEQDQRDRQGKIDWSVVAPRDDARRRRVREIMAAGGAKAADDYYHAAMVFQHGNEAADARQAHEWALHAVELDRGHDNAKWLAAAAQDRYLMRLGKPQKYGTQFRLVDGRWVLWQVDPSITDEERAKWNVPPLDEARRRAEAMNR